MKSILIAYYAPDLLAYSWHENMNEGTEMQRKREWKGVEKECLRKRSEHGKEEYQLLHMKSILIALLWCRFTGIFMTWKHEWKVKRCRERGVKGGGERMSEKEEWTWKRRISTPPYEIHTHSILWCRFTGVFLTWKHEWRYREWRRPTEGEEWKGWGWRKEREMGM